MSPRAACRLESLGFTDVYDYAPGKTDWTGSGLPTEGTHANIPRPGRLARSVPTVGLEDPVATARERAGDVRVCIVTAGDGLVLGRIRGEALGGEDDTPVAEVMEPGPTTVRYDELLPGLVERMTKQDVESILVTKPSGQLVGVMYRNDAEALLEQLQNEHDHHEH